MPRILLDACGNAAKLHLPFHMTWNTQRCVTHNVKESKRKWIAHVPKRHAWRHSCFRHPCIEDHLRDDLLCLSEDTAFVVDHPAEKIEAIDGTLLRSNRATKASFKRLHFFKINPHPSSFNLNSGSIVGRSARWLLG